MKDKKPKVLDLFSGIGGFSLGLERAGMETVAFCEQDGNCQKVLNKHWPRVHKFNDVRSLKYKDGYLYSKLKDWNGIHTTIDVVCGGFPCQDVSVAGNKKGFKDELEKRTRSGLWEEFARIIKEVKPRYAIIENVANLRNLGLNQVIKDLWSIGYACEWHIISARSIGACHLRERIWIIAYPHCTELQEQSGWGFWSNREKETQPGNIGENGEATNADGLRLEGSGQHGQPCNSKENEDREIDRALNGGTNTKSIHSTNPNLPRLWQPFASEEASQRWWAEATASFRDWWEIESSICRVDDGLPRGLDKGRKERIRQLGNTILPQIPEIIGCELMKRSFL